MKKFIKIIHDPQWHQIKCINEINMKQTLKGDWGLWFGWAYFLS